MNRYALALLVLLLVSLSIFAQTPDAAKSNGGGAAAASSIPPAPAITDTSTPTELARAALAARDLVAGLRDRRALRGAVGGADHHRGEPPHVRAQDRRAGGGRECVRRGAVPAGAAAGPG